MDNPQEKKLAIDYITTLYLNMQNLKHWFSLYVDNNVMIGMSARNKDIYDGDSLSSEGLTILKNIRYHLVQFDLEYNTIADTIGINNTDQDSLNVLYHDLFESQRAVNAQAGVFKIDALRKYILTASKQLFASPVGELLRNNSELIGKIYNANTNTS